MQLTTASRFSDAVISMTEEIARIARSAIDAPTNHLRRSRFDIIASFKNTKSLLRPNNQYRVLQNIPRLEVSIRSLQARIS